jgi:predicted LPLAT superfamily acyltransferase
MNERLVVWNDRTIEITETIMLRLKRVIPAKIAHQIIQTITPQIATQIQIAETTTVALETEITIDVIVDAIEIVIEIVTEVSVKSVRYRLAQMMFCYQ